MGSMLPGSFKLGRRERGWSVEFAAALYGKYVRGKPVSNIMIYKLEEGFMPQDEKRRWVLSRMYNIAPAALGLKMTQPPRTIPATYRKARSVDVKEYQSTLISYWKNGYKGSFKVALIDLGTRINSLHEHAWYSAEKEQMKRLLCGYHIRRAEVAREVGYDRDALDHYNRAVILARENNYTDLFAASLYRRGEFHFDRWELTKALRDFNEAETISKTTMEVYPAPPDVLGQILVVKGATLARMAHSEKDMAKAMSVIGLAKNLVRAEVQELGCMIDFPQATYNTNYIKALLGSPLIKLHRPNEADSLLEGVYRESTSARDQTYDLIEDRLLTALIYTDKGYHAAATDLLGEALKLIGKDYRLYIPVIEHAYDLLLASPYGKSEEVAELGLQLLFVQMPHLFN